MSRKEKHIFLTTKNIRPVENLNSNQQPTTSQRTTNSRQGGGKPVGFRGVPRMPGDTEPVFGSDILPSPTDVPESLQEDDENDLSLLIDGGDVGGETLGNFLWSADPFDEAEDLEALFNPDEEDDTLSDTSVWQQESGLLDPDSWEEAVPAVKTKLQVVANSIPLP